MNFETHTALVRDAWNFLKYYLKNSNEFDPKWGQLLPRDDVYKALAYFYDLRTIGWKIHGEGETADEEGISPLWQKKSFLLESRTETSQYNPQGTVFEGPDGLGSSYCSMDGSWYSLPYPDQVGCILGYQASHIDRLEDTWCLCMLCEALDDLADLGAGAVNLAADGADVLAETAIAPLYAVVYVFCWLFGGCRDWSEPGDVIPDIPEIPDPEVPYGEGPYTALADFPLSPCWQFINMIPPTVVPNSPWMIGNLAVYDDHDGYYWKSGIGSWQEFLLDLASNISQTHLVPFSNDPCGDGAFGPMTNYQVRAEDANDEHPPTSVTDPIARFCLPPILSVIFSPIDNLGKYGWDQWCKRGDIFYLGYTLHAIGDCATAHHTVCTNFNMHQEYEDYIMNYYSDFDGKAKTVNWTGEDDEYPFKGLLSFSATGWPDHYQAIWAELGDYVSETRDFWLRNPNHAAKRNLPIRNLLTSLAQKTFDSAVSTPSVFDFNEQDPPSDLRVQATTAVHRAIALTAWVLVNGALARQV